MAKHNRSRKKKRNSLGRIHRAKGKTKTTMRTESPKKKKGYTTILLEMSKMQERTKVPAPRDDGVNAPARFDPALATPDRIQESLESRFAAASD